MIGRQKEIWPQIQLLRALMCFATLQDRSDLWVLYSKSLNLLNARFSDSENGGWFHRQDARLSADPRATDKGEIGISDGGITDYFVEALDLHNLNGSPELDDAIQ